MTHQPRYMMPIDEDELFEWGATSWRMDIVAFREIKAILEGVEWYRPDGIPAQSEGYIPDNPVGLVGDRQKREIEASFNMMLNDVSLVPGIAQMGTFRVNGVEIQNGSFDPAWHHDGLAGKRMGHAGDFFAIAYFGEPVWDDAWGGHYEYAKRRLSGEWPTQEFEPLSNIRKVAPAERNILLGWNQNPRLVHRATPMRVARNRVAIICSIDLEMR